MMPPYVDVADLPEDKRIELIGKQITDGKTIGFFVDVEGADGMAKADRYIAKLLSWVPDLVVTHKALFSDVPNVVLVKVVKGKA